MQTCHIFCHIFSPLHGVQVVVKDGRELIGDLLCLDKQGNLILGNTYEQVKRQALQCALQL